MPKTFKNDSERDSRRSNFEQFSPLRSPVSICGHCRSIMSTSEEASSHVCFRTSRLTPEELDLIKLVRSREQLSADGISAEQKTSAKLILAVVVCLIVVGTILQLKPGKSSSEFEIKRQTEAAMNETLPGQTDTPTNGVVGLF